MHTRNARVRAIPYRGSSEVYIIPRDILSSWQTRARNASFLRSSESQEFHVVILLSWVPGSLFPWKDARIKVTRYCRRRLTLAFHPVAREHSQFLVFYASKKSLFLRIWYTFILFRYYSTTIFPICISRDVESTLDWFFNLVRDFFILQLYFALWLMIIFLLYNILPFLEYCHQSDEITCGSLKFIIDLWLEENIQWF